MSVPECVPEIAACYIPSSTAIAVQWSANRETESSGITGAMIFDLESKKLMNSLERLCIGLCDADSSTTYGQ